ncbi:hypothetical protein G7Y79_00002g005570 [Physcia stellaris]|nr:hypothetical protein G7Y79_00002g005570 [Physcia stellaris]
MPPTRICVFCGSSSGTSPIHLAAARSLAQTMHSQSIHLVYGGGTTGMMGELARTLVGLSGKDSVQGIIPSSMLHLERPETDSKDRKLPRNWSRRIGLQGDPAAREKKDGEAQNLEDEYGRVTIVRDLQARKKEMMELVKEGGPGSGFVGLSGGFGTIDEVMEVVSWKIMGVHSCGIVLYNVDGFWDGIMAWIEKSVEQGFIKGKGRNMLVQRADVEGVIDALRGKGGEENTKKVANETMIERTTGD